ncbi:MAG: N-6 DNA methylase [Spirochaetales bacterium]|nr:N-6 DNA methylase [Spirochaetales bacterium]
MSDECLEMSDVSAATTRNWAKLHTNSDGRLTGRANKRRSKKNIIPLEYITNSKNIPILTEIVSYIRTAQISVEAALYSVGVALLRAAGIADCEHVRVSLSKYQTATDEFRVSYDYPVDERDVLGCLYQCLMTEGRKNIIGSYYTPPSIVCNMTEKLDFSQDQTFLDPCCGSGAYLMSLKCDNPDLLFGTDADRTAVMICRINLLLKYRSHRFVPHIYNEDFLLTERFAESKFDYIVTNPPWGAMPRSQNGKKSACGETFSLFFIRSFGLLKENGFIRFLFPYSVLNVKTHKELRRFMLSQGKLNSETV